MEFTNFNGRQRPSFGSVNNTPKAEEETWMTVQEAVTHATQLGLNRTPKTIGEWARKSYEDPERGVVVARKQDIENGFRYVISKASLELKIKEEKDLEAKSGASTQVYTGEHMSKQVYTGVHTSTPVYTGEDKTKTADTENKSDHNSYEDIIEEKNKMIEMLREQNEFLREELTDRREIAGSLTDVITAFKLNAETQAHLTLGSRAVETENDATDPLWGGEEIKQ